MKVLAAVLLLIFSSSVVVAHEGECLESSPPGKCCHYDSEGRKHCHNR